MFKFLIRPGCHLCDTARPLVEREIARRNWSLLEVDIDSADGLLEDFGARVPVLLAPDGAVIAEGRIESRSLRQAIRGWMRRG